MKSSSQILGCSDRGGLRIWGVLEIGPLVVNCAQQMGWVCCGAKAMAATRKSVSKAGHKLSYWRIPLFIVDCFLIRMLE